MRNDQLSINRWTWIIALLLAILLLWMLLTGHGPSSICCSQTETSTMPATPATLTETAPQPFSFSATHQEVKTKGDTDNVAWLSKAEELRTILSAGEDLRLEGGDKTVMLTGVCNSEAERRKKGEELQAFFGPNVSIDNQLAILPAPTTPAAPSSPAAVKLYFDSGKTTLPADKDTTLGPIIEWLKANPDSKAVLSGYHDARGNQAFNEELAKNRAKAVREALKAAGIDEARIEMHKPEVVEGGSDLQEARRVGVSVE